MQGWGYTTLLADPQGVALIQEVTKLIFVSDHGSFLSYSLPSTTDGWRNERLVVQRPP